MYILKNIYLNWEYGINVGEHFCWIDKSCRMQNMSSTLLPNTKMRFFCLPSSFQRSPVISFLSRQRLSFLFHFDLLQSRLKSRTPSRPAILQLQRGGRWWMARTETDWDFGTRRRRNWNLPDSSFPMEKERVRVAAAKCCSDWGRERLGI